MQNSPELMERRLYLIQQFSSGQTSSMKEGRMELEDNSRSGRPVTGPTEENIEKVRKIIEQDPHCTYVEID